MAGPATPYAGVTGDDQLLEKTRELIEAHPLDPAEVVDVVKGAWSDIFASGFGKKKFKIGKSIFPKPQIMGFFLHELIPLELASRHPKEWRPEQVAADKDAVYIPDDYFSVEIKTSSHKSQIFGNRSYAQKVQPGASKKSKDGHYLAVNFEKFSKSVTKPKVVRVRFGWLDHADWLGQQQASGQQARLTTQADRCKLIELFPNSQL